MNFDELNLNKPLLNALDELEYTNPTPIQEKTFSPIMSGRDVVGIAQTGTGKTFAYLLPLLRQYQFSKEKHPSILVVVPTRELVLQVVEEVEKLTKYINIRSLGVYGGTNINTQKQLVYNGIDLLVATPGRLYDLAVTGILRLNDIKKLVIDEVDEMFALGFRPQLLNIMEILPKKRQNLMFSATLTEDVRNFIDDFFYEPQKIEVDLHGTPIEKIIQKAYSAQNFNTKVNLLEYLLNEDETLSKVLVFVSTKKLADRLFEQMQLKFPDKFGVIHSNKSQNTRISTLNKFHENEYRALIATDILARGLDIRDVTHVINFDTPKVPSDYIHRIGRTGRKDKDGISITFFNEIEQLYIADIEMLMKMQIPLVDFPENVDVSDVFSEEEKPNLADKNYFKASNIKKSQGAFHEKKEKNKKVNLGGPGKRNQVKRKPIKRKPKKRK
ncbi:MAG: DEAD/DEAH box helicase [Bacteroidales bacterium]|nr:DEAD/DEAH box helicase [Bacteroidales bacterium]MBN2757184.1 DEAD/DEAH box helicase [Bacteroidales bacterium]